MTQPCPICGKPAETPRLRPFCCKRCAEVDLGRWFSGAYAVPSPAVDLDDDSLSSDAPERG